MRIDKAKVKEMLAWLDGLSLADDAGSRCFEMLADDEIATDGGGLEARRCFEMARPERGLVRVKKQEAPPNAPLGVVTRTTWVVTELGQAVCVAHRKRERKAEIRAAAVREISDS